MILTSLFIAGLETALNRILFRDPALKMARQRLAGKILSFELKEFSRPLTLIFTEQQVDVSHHWEGESDCVLKAPVTILPALRERNRLTSLLRSGELIVEGDLQVIQHFSALIDMAELDPAEYLAPWTGDIVAHGISQRIKKLFTSAQRGIQRKQHYLAEALTEEWRLVSPALEQAWFSEEVIAIDQSVEALSVRLTKLEVQ